MSMLSRIPDLFGQILSLGLRRKPISLLALFGALVVVITACKKDDLPPSGRLMVVLQTDMSLPKDVSRVHLQVVELADSSNKKKNNPGGNVRHDETYDMAPDGPNPLPSTFAIINANGRQPTVEVRVRGIRHSKNQPDETRIFTKVITTLPKTRAATLRVPIEWLCDGYFRADGDFIDSSCPNDADDNPQTCRAGVCQPATIKEKDLPDYEPREVFGGGEDLKDDVAVCFPTEQCFDGGYNVLPDAKCRVTLNLRKGREANFGLTVGAPPDSDGICGELGCYVPLDQSEFNGWRALSQDNMGSGVQLRAQLPEGVCVEDNARRFLGVRVSDECETKTPGVPTCGPWNEIKGQIPTIKLGEDIPEPIRIGADAGDASTIQGAGIDGGAVSLPPGKEPYVASESGEPVVNLGEELQLKVYLADVLDSGLAPPSLSDAGLPSGEPLSSAAIKWTSSDPKVATVDNNGVVTGVAPGTVTIIAHVGSREVEFDVEVALGPPVQLQIASFRAEHQRALPASLGKPTDPCQKALASSTGTEVNLPEGCALDVGVTGHYRDDSSAPVEGGQTWTSSNPEVLTIVDGQLVAVGPGEAEATVVYQGREASVQITVTEPALIALTVAAVPDAPSAQGINGATQLRALGYYTDSDDPVDVTTLVAWSSADPAIVTIDESGLAQGHQAGETTIAAELDGVRLQSSFTVTLE